MKPLSPLAAQAMGRAYAKLGRPITDCPFDQRGDATERVNAVRFVHGYLDEKPPTDVDYGD